MPDQLIFDIRNERNPVGTCQICSPACKSSFVFLRLQQAARTTQSILNAHALSHTEYLPPCDAPPRQALTCHALPYSALFETCSCKRFSHPIHPHSALCVACSLHRRESVPANDAIVVKQVHTTGCAELSCIPYSIASLATPKLHTSLLVTSIIVLRLRGRLHFMPLGATARQSVGLTGPIFA